MTLTLLLDVAIVTAVVAPGAAAAALGLIALLLGSKPSERTIVVVVGAALALSLVATVIAGRLAPDSHEVNLGPWIHLDDYAVPLTFLVDDVALTFSLLAAALTAVVARFSRTYLHKEAGFLRFYVLHCVAIPLAAAVLIAIHFWRVRKDGGISGAL